MNTFGSAQIRCPLYDPRGARESRARFRRDMLPALERANSLYCPAGRWPVRGWLLLARSDYARLDPYSTSLSLEAGDPLAAGNVATLGGLTVVQARCATRGLASDPNALYLVEVTDARGVLQNEWFQFGLIDRYNVRAPAYPETFMALSMNSLVPVTTTWTWSTMLGRMWNQFSTLMGSWPGLPFAPAGTPEGFFFVGVPIWPAICDVLDHLGLSVAPDPTVLVPAHFAVVSGGAADPAFAVAEARYTGNLEEDAEYIDSGSGRVPGVVSVLFRRRNAVYGTEETVTYKWDDIAQQWEALNVYSKSFSAPAAFTGAVGSHFIWSDYTVRFDENSVSLPEDRVTANAIAEERVTQYFRRIYNGTVGSMFRTYAGALPFACGPQVDGVAWVQDGAEGVRAGWRTHVIRGDVPRLWPAVYGPGAVA